MWSTAKNILKFYLAFYAFCAHVFYPFALILESDFEYYSKTGKSLVVIVFIIDMAAVVSLAVGALASRTNLLLCSLFKLVAECLYYIYRLTIPGNMLICLKRYCSRRADSSTNYFKALGMLKLRKCFLYFINHFNFIFLYLEKLLHHLSSAPYSA